MSLGYGAPSRCRPVRAAERRPTTASSWSPPRATPATRRAHGQPARPRTPSPPTTPGCSGSPRSPQDGTPAGFSSDNLSVQVAAPGVDVPAQGRDGQYWLVSGTSPACALTAGVAALIKSRYPALAPALVVQAITVQHPEPAARRLRRPGRVRHGGRRGRARRRREGWPRQPGGQAGAATTLHFGGGAAAVSAGSDHARGARQDWSSRACSRWLSWPSTGLAGRRLLSLRRALSPGSTPRTGRPHAGLARPAGSGHLAGPVRTPGPGRRAGRRVGGPGLAAGRPGLSPGRDRRTPPPATGREGPGREGPGPEGPGPEERGTLPDFASRVLDVAESIPPGRVMSYGDVAEYLGAGRPAPGRPGHGPVGRRRAWWRVVHADGSLLAGTSGRARALPCRGHPAAAAGPTGRPPGGHAPGPLGRRGNVAGPESSREGRSRPGQRRRGTCRSAVRIHPGHSARRRINPRDTR